MARVPDDVSVPPSSELEGTSQERYTKVLHACICSIIAILVGFLQLKQGAENESLFHTYYPVMVSLLIALTAYTGSLLGSIILHGKARPNLDLAKSIINKISLFLGTLVLILEVGILVPGLGVIGGLLWVVLLVKVVRNDAIEYLKKLYGNVVHIFKKLKDYLKMIIQRFATEPEGQTNELPQGTSTAV